MTVQNWIKNKKLSNKCKRGIDVKKVKRVRVITILTPLFLIHVDERYTHWKSKRWLASGNKFDNITEYDNFLH